MIDTLVAQRHHSVAAAPSSLDLHGYLPQPRRFSPQDLQSLERQAIGPVEIRCFTGRHVADVASMAGARLADVLDAAGFSTLPRPERKRCVIAGIGRDGYLALFTWSELYNTEAGARVLVLYERERRPLDESIGAFDLIAGGDLRLGPRHLRGLQGIRVSLL